MNFKLLAITLLASSMSTVVLAADDAFRPYVVGSAAYSQLRDSSPGNSKDTYSDKAFTLGAGLRFNKYFSVEARYVDAGKYEITGTGPEVDIKGSGYSLGVLGFLPLSERVSLFARLDAERLKVKGQTQGVEVNDTKTDPNIGAGIQYEAGYGVALRAQAERTRVKAFGGKDDLDSYGVSLLKAF